MQCRYTCQSTIFVIGNLNIYPLILLSDIFSINTHTMILSIIEKTTKEKSEDTKAVIRSRKSNKDRQHNGQKKKDKQRSTKYINTTQKTKD